MAVAFALVLALALSYAVEGGELPPIRTADELLACSQAPAMAGRTGS